MKKIFCVALMTILLYIFSQAVLQVYASNAYPVPVITGPDVVEAGIPYQFDASSSYDPDGYIAGYDWFASGTDVLTSKNMIQTFVWKLAGTKSIFLKVTDDRGRSRQTFKTLTIIDSKPPMPGISHSLGPKVITIGQSASLTVFGYPPGAAFEFFDDGGSAAVSISGIGDTAQIAAHGSGDKKIGYIVSHPEHASYRGYADLVINTSGLLTMKGISWYSPSGSFETGSRADIYITGAPAGSVFSFETAAGSSGDVILRQENMCRIMFDSPGEVRMIYSIACAGYSDHTGQIVLHVSDTQAPVAVITGIGSGYTGEKYVFSASNSSSGIDSYEWKWHSTNNQVVASRAVSFEKLWKADEYGTYILYSRVGRDGLWSAWTSKSVEIRQGISFDADGVYSGTKTITDAQWAYIKGKIGSGYEKSYIINGKAYLFNVEIYQDKKLIVYGDHTLDGYSSNPFTTGSEGVPYFRKDNVPGEYKYLGFVYGTTTPFSNQNFKAANMLILDGTAKNARLITFEELPSYVKGSWGITGASNIGFSALAGEINSSSSYNLTNSNSSNHPSPLILKNVFDIANAGFDPYRYGIVNFFDKYTGGSIRMFFEYFSNGGYDWRTFEGILASDRQCPEISLFDDMEKSAVAGALDEEMILRGSVFLEVYDQWQTNVLLHKSLYYYDRNDPYAKTLEIRALAGGGRLIVLEDPKVHRYYANSFLFSREAEFRVRKDELKTGLNIFEFEVSGGIAFSPSSARSEKYTFSLYITYNPSSIPLVETKGADDLTGTGARLGYQIHETGTPPADMAGIYVNGPSYSSRHEAPEPVEGIYSVRISGLQPGTTYTYKAFITQNSIEYFGEEKSFTTLRGRRDAPLAPVVTEITQNSAKITSSDGSYIVCNNEEKPSGSYFYGLNENSIYETYAYYKADTVFERSDNSEIVYFRTLGSPYILPDKYIHIGQTVIISDCDRLEVLEGDDHVYLESKQIKGREEGVARIKGIKGTKESDFSVYVFPLPDEGENIIIGFKIKRIFDPDFADIRDIGYYEMPVFEHIDSGMIDLGYMVSCEMEFSKNDVPVIPEIRIIDNSGSLLTPWYIAGKEMAIWPLVIQDAVYENRMLRFDIYIPPFVKFFKEGQNVSAGSIQTVKEILICLETPMKIEPVPDGSKNPVIYKGINSGFLEIFWYNLRRNCYDDVGYEKGW